LGKFIVFAVSHVPNLRSPTASEDAGIEPKTSVEFALTSDGLTMLRRTVS
jgi:hypothetical protein